MMTVAALFLSTFAVVFCLGAQSLFTNNGKYLLAFGNSFLIGLAHLCLYKLVPGTSDPWQIAAYLCGGPLGIVSAMTVFRRLHRRQDSTVYASRRPWRRRVEELGSFFRGDAL